MIAAILEYVILGYEYFIVACIVAVGIGSFLFAISITKVFQSVLHDSINDKTDANTIQSNEMMILLSEFIDAHGFAKQLSISSRQ